MPVTSVAIHKGGPGKTTLALHLAYYLAEKRSARTGDLNRVLLIDCDPQGNSTQTLTDENPGEYGTSQLFIDGGTPALPLSTFFPNISVIGPNAGLRDLEDGLPDFENRKRHYMQVFRSNVRGLLNSFDHIVIDTPPTLGFGMGAPLTGSDFVFSPFEPGPYNLKGLSSLNDRIEEIRGDQNPDLINLGLLINRWNKRNVRQNETVELIRQQPGLLVIPFEITERAPIGKVAFDRSPVWTSKSGAARVAAKELRGALEYLTKRIGEAA